MNTQNTLHSKMPCFSATFQPSNSFIKNNQIRPMRSLANRIPFSISILPWRVFWGCASDWTIFFAIPFSLFVTLFLVKQIVLIYYCQEVDLRFFWIMAVLLCIFYNNNNITYQFYINIKYTYSIEFLKKKKKKTLSKITWKIEADVDAFCTRLKLYHAIIFWKKSEIQKNSFDDRKPFKECKKNSNIVEIKYNWCKNKIVFYNNNKNFYQNLHFLFWTKSAP